MYRPILGFSCGRGAEAALFTNVSTYVHDYGAANTRPAGSADTSAHTGPECSRDVSTDDNFDASTARGLRCYFDGYGTAVSLDARGWQNFDTFITPSPALP